MEPVLTIVLSYPQYNIFIFLPTVDSNRVLEHLSKLRIEHGVTVL